MTVVLSLASPASSMAATVSELKEKETATKAENATISEEITLALADVNSKYQNLEELKNEVAATQEKIADTEQHIKEIKKSIEARMELMAGRLQDIQANGTSFNMVDALLEAEDFSDFLNRVYAVSVLQSAEKSKVNDLAADKETLTALKSDLEKNKTALTDKEESLTEETAVLDSKVTALQDKLANNQELLSQLSSERLSKEEQEKLAKERQKLIAISKETSTSSESSSSSTNSSSQTTETTTDSTVETKPSEPNTGGQSNQGGQGTQQPDTSGKTTLTMHSTAYSYTQPGLSFYTANGTDLRQNPNVVAVDPGVIPLGTMVEVVGLGYRLAADTGGDIVGTRIDIHFNTVDECRSWGRQTVTVRF